MVSCSLDFFFNPYSDDVVTVLLGGDFDFDIKIKQRRQTSEMIDTLNSVIHTAQSHLYTGVLKDTCSQNAIYFS